MSHDKKSIEEDAYDVPRKHNKIEGGAKCMKGALFNEENIDSYHYINEHIDDVDIII